MTYRRKRVPVDVILEIAELLITDIGIKDRPTLKSLLLIDVDVTARLLPKMYRVVAIRSPHQIQGFILALQSSPRVLRHLQSLSVDYRSPTEPSRSSLCEFPGNVKTLLSLASPALIELKLNVLMHPQILFGLRTISFPRLSTLAIAPSFVSNNEHSIRVHALSRIKWTRVAKGGQINIRYPRLTLASLVVPWPNITHLWLDVACTNQFWTGLVLLDHMPELMLLTLSISGPDSDRAVEILWSITLPRMQCLLLLVENHAWSKCPPDFASFQVNKKLVMPFLRWNPALTNTADFRAAVGFATDPDSSTETLVAIAQSLVMIRPTNLPCFHSSERYVIVETETSFQLPHLV
ncbi:hypothetical protein VNI00_018366 [Paramarasmius palmivorus]|uniref:Uncharacterized protein n=1 Tax=Paramarasmius palmivorus TaxID=297713 RepID=A0AAW0AYZ7_9AGAR